MSKIVELLVIAYIVIAFWAMLYLLYRWGENLSTKQLEIIKYEGSLVDLLIIVGFILQGVVWPISWIYIKLNSRIQNGTTKKIRKE